MCGGCDDNDRMKNQHISEESIDLVGLDKYLVSRSLFILNIVYIYINKLSV